MFLPLSIKSLAGKTGGAMILAATSDALVGAAATIVVGLLAAISAIVVATIQSRNNRRRDEAVEEMVKLTTRLSELEKERADGLARQLAERNAEDGEAT